RRRPHSHEVVNCGAGPPACGRPPGRPLAPARNIPAPSHEVGRGADRRPGGLPHTAMVIGVPKEVKDFETRVGLTPSGAITLHEAGHRVLVETHAGEGSSITDHEYEQAGAEIAPCASDVWRAADLVVKVKEPQSSEYALLRPDLILFTYLHLAPLRELTEKLLEAKVTGIAYETIIESDGSLPLLTPMSEVAGRLAVQVGA